MNSLGAVSIPAILAPEFVTPRLIFFHPRGSLQDRLKSSFAPSAPGRQAKSEGALLLSISETALFFGVEAVPRGAPAEGVAGGFGAAPFAGRLPGPQPCAKLHQWLVVTDDPPIKP